MTQRLNYAQHSPELFKKLSDLDEKALVALIKETAKVGLAT